MLLSFLAELIPVMVNRIGYLPENYWVMQS